MRKGFNLERKTTRRGNYESGTDYVLEYGDGFNLENPNAQLSRIDYVRDNFTPVPVLTATPLFGLAPLTVQLSSEGTADPDGDTLSLEGRVPGALVWPPRGEHGAGFEPMFMPHGQPQTYGEMRPEVRAELNHRAAAFRLLCSALGCVPAD